MKKINLGTFCDIIEAMQDPKQKLLSSVIFTVSEEKKKRIFLGHIRSHNEDEIMNQLIAALEMTRLSKDKVTYYIEMLSKMLNEENMDNSKEFILKTTRLLEGLETIKGKMDDIINITDDLGV